MMHDNARRSRRLSARLRPCGGGLSGAQAAATATAAPSTPPVFRSGVEALPIDVTVVNGRGEPVRDLSPRTSRSGSTASRGASSARSGLPRRPQRRARRTATCRGLRVERTSAGGRLIVLVIDQPNIPFGDMRPMREAIEAFIDRLSNADRVAVVGFGAGAKSTSFIADRDQLKQRARADPGQQQRHRRRYGSHEMGLDGGARHRSQRRNRRSARSWRATARGTPRAIQLCRMEIQQEAQQVAAEARHDADTTHPEPARRPHQPQGRRRAEDDDLRLAGILPTPAR